MLFVRENKLETIIIYFQDWYLTLTYLILNIKLNLSFYGIVFYEQLIA